MKFPFSISKKSPGTTLLITILIGMATLVAATALGYLGISEIRMASALKNASVAYYAAEAGIEQGLLFYKQNKNVQCSKDWDPLNPPNDVSKTPKENSEGKSYSIGDASYKLLIWYKTSSLMNHRLDKDMTREFDITGLTSLTLSFTGSNVGAEDYLEVKVITQDATGEWSHTLKAYKILTSSQTQTISADFNLLSTNKVQILRIKPLMENQNGFVTYSLTPTSPSGGLIDSGTTHIVSIGTFGGVNRKLEATINRQSGTIIDIFDYALYTKETISD